MTKCPSCSKEIPNESLSCPFCGVEINDSFAATRRLGDAPPPASTADSRSVRKTSTHATHSTTPFDSIDNARFIPGTTLADRYRIIGLLGKGGMGEVYRADDLTLGQPVALKFLPQNLSSDGAALARFHREVRTSRQVTHRNVCRVYDIGEVDGQQFLSMEFIRGEELSSLLRRIGRLPADKAVEIARQVCAGLAAAHDNGVLHRDLKPSNIMIDENGNVRITDFGLAGLAEEFRGEKLVEGTPGYMSPEQLNGEELTVRSDIYSLGLVLYEVFTGKKAFEARTLPELIRLRKSDTMPTNPSTLVKDLDPLVERVILRCLEKEPEERPASALQVAAALPGGDPLQAALAAGETPSPEMVAAAPKEGSLRPAVAMECLAALLLGLGVIIYLSNKVMLHGRVPLEKSPEILEDRAGGIAKKLGYTVPPTDTAYGFTYDASYLRYIRDNDSSPARWDKLATGQPAVIYFWYRQSPRYLEPYDEESVKPNDPPQVISGMTSMRLDTRGRLLFFDGVPPQTDDAQGASGAHPDWSPLFTEAGLDLARFKPTEPRWTPPHYSDARAAWDGVYPDQQQIPIRIEAAAYHGKPVYFQIVNPWDRPLREEQNQAGATERFINALVLVLAVVILLVGVLLARRNLLLGHGDRKGAFRLALFIFSVYTVSWIFGAHHIPAFKEESNLFFQNLAASLLLAGLSWLVYIALEPLVRRRWPHRIIGWSRLLTGDLRDPLIGRIVLIGGLLGICLTLTFYFWGLVPRWLGMPPGRPGLIAFSTLLGIRGLLQWFAIGGLVTSVLNAFYYLFLLLLLSIVLRREWLTVGVSWLLLALIFILIGSNPAIDWFFAGLAATIITFTLLRFGLLALMCVILFCSLSYQFPITPDFSVWYAGAAIFALVVIVALAAYGFYTSLAGQPLFQGKFLQD